MGLACRSARLGCWVAVLLSPALLLTAGAQGEGTNPPPRSPTLTIEGDIVPLLAAHDFPRLGEQQEAIEVSPARAKMYEAMVEVQDGLYEQAIPKLEWVISQDPTLLGAWETLGWAYWLVDRRKDAEQLWTRLTTIAPNEPMGYNLLAQVATRDGDLERAESLYRQSLRLNPDQFEVRLNLGRVLLWAGKHEEATSLLRALHREDPERIDVEIDLAWALYANEEYEDSLDHWNRINELIPDNASFLLARANASILLGDLRAAEADARRALQLEPRNASALNMLAAIAVQTSDPHVAVDALRQLTELSEDDQTKSSIYMRIAAYVKSLIDKGNRDFKLTDVIKYTREAVSFDDHNIGARLFLGEMLTLNKQYEEAEKVFRQVLDEFNPFNHRARFGLVETYFGRAMYDEVERQLRENYRLLNPNHPFRHIYWARLHFARGNFVAAYDALDRLEQEGSQGAVFTLLYHGISPSEFSDMPSSRQIREHIQILKRDGFRFLTPTELPAYFANKEGAQLAETRPLLYRVVQYVKYAFTGERPAKRPSLRDYTPDKVAMVTFDDGLRNSYRYGTEIGQDLGVRFAMFVGVGDLISRRNRYIASIKETRQFLQAGVWELHSHLMDAGEPAPLDAAGRRRSLPLANRIWRSDRNRLETLYEYQQRLKREFRESKRILARELGIPTNELVAVAYPYGEVGQGEGTNIREFIVPHVILNEAETSYTMGFVQDRFGYTMKTDDPLLYKRYEPRRFTSARDLLREAYRQHPVFVARRMRAEFAALNGNYHLARENYELLRRDGYPEEDLAEVDAYIKRYLARIAPVEEVPEEPGEKRTRSFSIRKPYVGAFLIINRANEVIDDQELGVEGGVNLTRRTRLGVHAGYGSIDQTIRSNVVVETERTTQSRSTTIERRVENGVVTDAQIDRTTITTTTIFSNRLEEFSYSADKTFVGLSLSYVHVDGSYTLADIRQYTLSGDDVADEGGALTYGIEHQWRPVPALDMAARYQHGLVPSARAVIEYDSLLLRPFWRVMDGWDASAAGVFAYYEDKNSFLKTSIENMWRISRPYDIWFGLHNSLETVDRDSGLYYSPYWEQRHYLILRFRRSFPNFFAMFKLHLGVQKEEPRRDELDRFLAAKARGEQEGWSPGLGPDQSWQKLLGFAAELRRRYKSGWEVGGDFNVNSSGEYTEHTIALRLRYNF